MRFTNLSSSRSKLFLIGLLLLLSFFNPIDCDAQTINGKVVAKTKDGERGAPYVNVSIYNHKKLLVSRGKTNGEGLFHLHPAGGYNFHPEEKYTIVVEPDPKEKNLSGERINKVKAQFKGAELSDITINTTTSKNKDKNIYGRHPRARPIFKEDKSRDLQ